MKNDSDVNDANRTDTKATYIAQELKNGYYNLVEKAVELMIS